MCAHSVSPPYAGHSSANSMVAIGGSSKHVMSTCQLSPTLRVGFLAQLLLGPDRTEPQCEPLPLLLVEELVAEEDDAVLGPGPPDGCIRRVRVVAGEIEAANLRADVTADAVHLGQVCHLASSFRHFRQPSRATAIASIITVWMAPTTACSCQP